MAGGLLGQLIQASQHRQGRMSEAITGFQNQVKQEKLKKHLRNYIQKYGMDISRESIEGFLGENPDANITDLRPIIEAIKMQQGAQQEKWQTVTETPGGEAGVQKSSLTGKKDIWGTFPKLKPRKDIKFHTVGFGPAIPGLDTSALPKNTQLKITYEDGNITSIDTTKADKPQLQVLEMPDGTRKVVKIEEGATFGPKPESKIPNQLQITAQSVGVDLAKGTITQEESKKVMDEITRLKKVWMRETLLGLLLSGDLKIGNQSEEGALSDSEKARMEELKNRKGQ